jgi:hypothetical protein
VPAGRRRVQRRPAAKAIRLPHLINSSTAKKKIRTKFSVNGLQEQLDGQ